MHRLHNWTAYKGDLLVHLRSLLAVREQAGRPAAFQRAARGLNVDESVLRRRLAALTAVVGEELVEGRGVRLRLTAAGQKASEVAARVVEELARLGQPEAPRLSVGCTGTIANELLPEVVVALQSAHPEVVVHVARTGAEETARRVEDGSLDLGVLRASTAPRTLEHRFVSEDRLFLAVRRDHPLARGPLDVARLATHPIITFRRTSATRARVMDVLQPLGATTRIEVEGKSLALRYVELGLGIAFVSVLARRPPRTDTVVLRDVSRWFAPTSFWLVWRHGRKLRPWEELAALRLAR